MSYAHLAHRAEAAADDFRRAAEIMPSNGRAWLGLQQSWKGADAWVTRRRWRPQIQDCLMQLASGGRLAEAAMLGAAIETARGDSASAYNTLSRLLEKRAAGAGRLDDPD